MIQMSQLVRGAPSGRFLAKPGVTKPDEVIDDFSEFAYTTSDPAVEAKLRALARRIVRSHNAGPRIIGFEVQGHADATLRPPPGQSAAVTEMEVSTDRAENAKDQLIELIEEEGGKPIIAGIKANATAKGFGSKFRVFVPARTEQQMKKNRRVEIFLKVLDPPPQPKPVPPQPQPNPSQFTIQIKGGTILTVGIPGTDSFGVSSLTYQLNVEVVDTKRRQKALFIVVATGIALPGASVAMGAISTTTVTEGAATKPFLSGTNVKLDKFSGGVELTQDPGGGVSVLAFGGDINFLTFEHLKTTPSVISASNGTGFATLPGGSLGGSAKGTMTMVGGVKSF